jgi:hypothetical protein
MAKAKKTKPVDPAPPVAAASDKPVAGKPPVAKAKKPAVAPPAPMVDTTLAAQAAAKQLVAGLAPPMAAPAAGHESASFKLMKQNLAKPAVSGLDSVLDKTALPNSRKGSNVPFAGPKSIGNGGGRNQTFGADVNRSGVPRRTSGG